VPAPTAPLPPTAAGEQAAGAEVPDRGAGGRQLEKLDEIVGKAFVDRSPGAGNLRGHGGGAAGAEEAPLPVSRSSSTNPQELIAEDDRVAARYLVLATPRADGGGPAPPPLVLNGVAHFQIRDGRIQEAFVLHDQVGLLRSSATPWCHPAPALRRQGGAAASARLPPPRARGGTAAARRGLGGRCPCRHPHRRIASRMSAATAGRSVRAVAAGCPCNTNPDKTSAESMTVTQAFHRQKAAGKLRETGVISE